MKQNSEVVYYYPNISKSLFVFQRERQVVSVEFSHEMRQVGMVWLKSVQLNSPLDYCRRDPNELVAIEMQMDHEIHVCTCLAVAQLVAVSKILTEFSQRINLCRNSPCQRVLFKSQ